MAESTTITVLERSNIHPSPEAAAAELTLPLIHFDMPFLFFHPMQGLLFFEFPCSRSQFLETIVPNLKQSLAQSLLHFLPLAGNIVSPVNSGWPVSRFVPGDSVSLTIAESDKDFDLLTGNHPRRTIDFYGCVANLPPAKRSEDEVVFAVLALQITLFPSRGVCIAFTTDHGIGDAISIVRFIKLWASVNKLSGDATTVVEKFLPSLDRSSVEDPDGLDSIYWNVVKNSRPMDIPATHFPTEKYRSTFILSDAHIKKLKSSILKSRPQMHVTTFTVTCALAWVCLVKAEDAASSAPAETDETEFFVFAADCRRRLKPPLPEAYFGNCLALVRAELAHGTLTGPNGISSAVESLGAAIKKTVYNEKGILDGAETWLEEFEMLVKKRIFGVAGSPGFDLYEVDYGWGGAKKFESLSIDADTSMSLLKSRDLEGGLEIGLSRRKEIVEAFAAEFAKTLEKLQCFSTGVLPKL